MQELGLDKGRQQIPYGSAEVAGRSREAEAGEAEEEEDDDDEEQEEEDDDRLDGELMVSLIEFVSKLEERGILLPEETEVLTRLIASGDTVVLAAYRVSEQNNDSRQLALFFQATAATALVARSPCPSPRWRG
jgi:hypothetical protein